MRNNILGGLVIFMVVLTCLLMIDDISNPKENTSNQVNTEVEKIESTTDLAIIDTEE
ncbi:hypothetical protein [uncultured Winogradskyella sp.]|uniref:hypothetical protein n=1 Tax=uncultured Winogradskyella sp. TaxID=395353 RepID=UPI0030D87471|nr:hypothetical protein [Winogradskyella sp.]|tara:strand:- start:50067 stop:50237 length:171 start_codon:yes stop_codon:yes gene_type:complete